MLVKYSWKSIRSFSRQNRPKRFWTRSHYIYLDSSRTMVQASGMKMEENAIYLARKNPQVLSFIIRSLTKQLKFKFLNEYWKFWFRALKFKFSDEISMIRRIFYQLSLQWYQLSTVLNSESFFLWRAKTPFFPPGFFFIWRFFLYGIAVSLK